jgi:uncharacterized protein YqhQ
MSGAPQPSAPQQPLRLGGMALRNGLLIHGPTHWAAAVRGSDGEIASASGPKPRLHALDRVPGLRGVARLGEAVAVIPLVRRALPQAQLPFQDPRTVATMLASAAAGTILRRRAGMTGEVAAAVISLAPALGSLRGGELAAYHGAEHKTIGAYERGNEAADAAKEHERCGSHLVAPLLAANLAGVGLLRRTSERPGSLASTAVGVASLSISLELLGWTERHPTSALARGLRAPGFALQRSIGTREPDEAQLAVARVALSEILRAEGVDAAPSPPPSEDLDGLRSPASGSSFSAAGR